LTLQGDLASLEWPLVKHLLRLALVIAVVVVAGSGGRAGPAQGRALLCGPIFPFTPCIVSVAINGAGSVTGLGISCPPTCTAFVTAVPQPVYTANPASGWVFQSWAGCDSGSGNPCVISSSRTIVATFSPPLSVSVSGQGTVTGPGISCPGTCARNVAFNTTISLTATPAAGWQFDGWGGSCSGTGGCSVLMNLARTVTATFSQIRHKLAFNGGGNGKVTSNPAGIDCAGHCEALYIEGTSVTLTATPDDGYAFDHWSGDCTGTSPTCQVTMTKDRAVAAAFRAVPVRLTVTRTGNGTVTSAPAGIACGGTCTFDFLKNTAVTLTAAPAAGAYFAGWSGACSGAAATCAVKVDVAKTVTATFRSPILTFSRVAFAVRWKESRPSGALALAGTASDGADITVTIGSGGAPVPLTLPTGSFSQSLPIPEGLLPGRVPVQIAATSHGVTLPPQQQSIALAAPPEGVAAAVEFSATAGGTATEKIPAGAKEINARFRLVAKPKPVCTTKKVKKKKRTTCKPRGLTVSWFTPAGQLAVRPVKKQPAAVIKTFVRSSAALPSGTWRVVLKAGNVTVLQGKIQVG
jgi:uncharacterized repeat protein (TIGR02543 family)